MRRTACLLIALLAAGTAFGKARFASKNEMIREADAIVVADVTAVEKTNRATSGWTYRQRAVAQVEQCLKGQVQGAIELFGQETFICAQCNFETGRQLLFLRRHPDGFWTGSNWHLGIRPIRDGQVDWLAGTNDVHTIKPASLSNVVSEVTAELHARSP